MNINVDNTGSNSIINTKKPTEITKVMAKESKTAPVESSVVYEKGSDAKPYKADIETMEQIKSSVVARTESLRILVEKLFEKQSTAWNDFLNTNSEQYVSESVKIDDETRAKAAELVSEDGYYGVAKTTERIIGFAKAISGGDPSKIELLREAVIKGFEKDGKAWGAELPDISQETYAAVMGEFDKWAAETQV